MASSKTERTASDDRRRASLVEPFLFLVLESARLSAGGLRLSLLDVDHLAIGRGDVRAASKAHERARTLTVPDARMSTVHARIVRRDGGFHLEDAGSTNGTLCNGESVTSVRVDDGDTIELGQTLFVFREISIEGGARAGDLDLATKAKGPTGLATFDPLYAPRLARLARVGSSGLSIMLLGETGTGKEVLARALHVLSQRPGPFVAVNCGAIPQSLVESQLFGHVRGSFSGATRDEIGLVRSANHGTLLLDEIGDLPPSSQSALLRVLQEGEVLPVGGTQPVKVDVRVLSATHKPLGQLVDDDGFRRDLYARLAGYVFALPPLRERKVDLGLLVASLLENDPRDAPLRLHREVASALLRYDWPMNVRELEQCLRASAILAEDGLVTVRELPPAILESKTKAKTSRALDPEDEELHRKLVAELTQARGNVSEVARAMGKARQQIQRWLRRFDLDPDSFR
ncbi:MAG: sigma 54-interacting transcriptional regulator [Polyangiales bacterium]